MTFPRGTPVWSRPPEAADSAAAAAVDDDRSRRAGTIALTGRAGHDPLSAEDAFGILYDHIRAHARTRPEGALVAAVSHSGQLLGARAVSIGHAVAFGRHPRCPIPLTAPTMALRQLVAHVQRDRSGTMVLRLWNLTRSMPFRTEDGQPTDAVAAEGPLFVSVESYAICLVPLMPPDGCQWPFTADEAWNHLPAREVITRLADGSQGAQRLPRPNTSPRARGTRITRMSAVVPLPEIGDSAEAVAYLQVADGNRGRTYAVTAEALQRGILVGRYDRCGAHVAHDERVSRVHLLVVSAEDGVWAIDTASSNGTTMAGGVLDAARLEDGAVLYLADSVAVAWRMVAVGAA